MAVFALKSGSGTVSMDFTSQCAIQMSSQYGDGEGITHKRELKEQLTVNISRHQQ